MRCDMMRCDAMKMRTEMPIGWERKMEKKQVGKPIKEEGEERSAVLVWNHQSPIGTCVCVRTLRLASAHFIRSQKRQEDSPVAKSPFSLTHSFTRLFTHSVWHG